MYIEQKTVLFIYLITIFDNCCLQTFFHTSFLVFLFLLVPYLLPLVLLFLYIIFSISSPCLRLFSGNRYVCVAQFAFQVADIQYYSYLAFIVVITSLCRSASLHYYTSEEIASYYFFMIFIHGIVCFLGQPSVTCVCFPYDLSQTCAPSFQRKS